ncbi:hypothetical protein BUALT_Bualt14G0055000 [Buddleja alternifolia]|uniref:Uncharacterized protein n=1 Tax=Buddleja alternifolia TaxID=168488 RepID=A0AAV6WS47_9LAMI|nr:hypothetical protein BUALT_Bualt14G0055000 [Buddleja alternifolia]
MGILFTYQNQSKYAKLENLHEKPIEVAKSKIHRLQEPANQNPGQIKATSAESGQNRDLNSNPNQLSKESTETGNSNNKKIDSVGISTVNAPTQLKEDLPKFGPFYFNNEPVLLKAWEEAWQLVLRKSVSETESINSTSEAQEKIKQDYVSAMRNVQTEAMDAYAGSGNLSVKGSDFHWMMIKDGCFFLQLALVMLGGAEALGHPPGHVIFGVRKANQKKIKTWLDAMFFVGNQIPLVILQELMKQSFFQQVIHDGKWEPPTVLSKRVLYELLVLPSLDIRIPEKRFLQWICCNKGRSARMEKDSLFLIKDKKPPCDILQGLRSMILGSREEPEESEQDEIDLEANWKASTSEEKRKINATSLQRAGITIKHKPGVGIRGIYFEETFCGANLHLPTFTVEDETEIILKNLKNYEINQPIAKNNREVCSYLRFMGDIICTVEDVNLLVKKGIIKGLKKETDKLPGIMRRLDCKDLTQHLYNVKLQISSYCAPAWLQYAKYVLNVVAILTFIQTLYTMIGYHHSSKC